jgi:hypothetical protein
LFVSAESRKTASLCLLNLIKRALKLLAPGQKGLRGK